MFLRIQQILSHVLISIHHANLTNSVIVYRGSCPVLYKLSAIIKIFPTSTTHSILLSALSNLSDVLLLHCDNNNTHFVVVLNSSVQNLRISPDTEPHTDTTVYYRVRRNTENRN